MGNRTTKLSELHDGETGVIININGHGAFRKRITEMGFIKGKTVKVIKNAPLQDPVEYEIMGYNISLRRKEAAMIEINPADISTYAEETHFKGTFTDGTLKKSSHINGKTIKIAFVGNPNSGKTSLFNYTSGSHERVGNYSGVTVDAKEATIKWKDYTLVLTDLPGTYSITEYSPEELYVRSHILEKKPDIVVNVIDSSNLERNLFLTTQLIDMNIKVVIAMNMFDELEKKGIKLNYTVLGKMMGIPIIPTVAFKGKGIAELMDKLVEVYEEKDPTVRHIHINYGSNIESSIRQVQGEIRKCNEIIGRISTRYLSIKLLENDQTTLNGLRKFSNFEAIEKKASSEIQKLEKEYCEKSETIITDAKYSFISGALMETCSFPKASGEKKRDIDAALTNKYLGFPIFIFIMWLMFQTTFTLGSYPMNWLNEGVSLLGKTISQHMTDGSLRSLIVDGIIGGVGGVIVFLPNILILFFFISLMEDTGYMSRVAFLMDKIMHKIGLHGKSFIPLLISFGCNVPGIMATRTLENRKDRLMTMLIAPFMSCSARLPVYIMIISAFFPKNQGLILCSIYLIGIIVAVLVALLLKNTVFAKQDVPFVMEMPPYRIPSAKNILNHMWEKGSQYLHKMGTTILIASIIIWGLTYFPKNVSYAKNYDSEIAAIQKDKSLKISEKTNQINEIQSFKSSEHMEKAYIGRIGHFIEPVLRPLGFDWKIGVCLVSGLAAKEIIVSTMGILYHSENSGVGGNTNNLAQKLALQKHNSGVRAGQKVFTPLVAFCFILFILLYFPCTATIAAISKEAGWKWAFICMFYTTAIAWLVAFSTYQIGNYIS